jgi:hypothetical protein
LPTWSDWAVRRRSSAWSTLSFRATTPARRGLGFLRTRQATTIVVQQYSFAGKLLSQNLIFELEVLDDHFLLLAYILDEFGKEDMQRLEEK